MTAHIRIERQIAGCSTVRIQFSALFHQADQNEPSKLTEQTGLAKKKTGISN
jgi:hypothetical protein